MPFELVMKTDLAKAIPQAIEFNYDELKKQLPERLAYYKNLVVTEDSIKSAKADKATLNKLRTAFEEARKEVKRDCLRPYEDFNSKESKLVGMIDEAIQSIDEQVKNFDGQKKEAKKQQIEDFFNKTVGSLSELLPLEKIWDPRWLNVSYKLSDIEKEIQNAIFKVRNNINIIKAFGVDCEQQMLDKYLEALDFSAAMAEKTRWEQQKRRLKEYEESQRKAQNPPNTIVVDGENDFSEAKPGDHVVFGGNPETQAGAYIPEPEQLPPIQQSKTISVTFLDTTADFRHEMHDLCVKYGIKYRWAKKEDL